MQTLEGASRATHHQVRTGRSLAFARTVAEPNRTGDNDRRPATDVRTRRDLGRPHHLLRQRVARAAANAQLEVLRCRARDRPRSAERKESQLASGVPEVLKGPRTDHFNAALISDPELCGASTLRVEIFSPL